jgi:hypothetical protein
MRSAQLAQLVAALIAVLTPWVVVRIAFAVASRQARSVQMAITRPIAMATLDRLTIVVLVPAVAAAVALPAPSFWMGVLDLALFAGLAIAGLRALGAIDEASRPAREGTAPVREASLKPRRLGDYVSPAWRGALILAQTTALGFFAWRLFQPASDRRLLVPVIFALAAPVFTWLYEVWMRELAAGGDVTTGDADAQRRRRIRQVFVMEVVLAATCLAVGHGLLDLDWNRHAAWGTGLSLAGACAGVVGCALAVSSELGRRKYQLVG